MIFSRENGVVGTGQHAVMSRFLLAGLTLRHSSSIARVSAVMSSITFGIAVPPPTSIISPRSRGGARVPPCSGISRL